MEWITDRLPALELSLSNGYLWRSKLVFVYHEFFGRHTAVLYASEGKAEMWWKLRQLDAQDKRAELGEIIGWLPLDTLPDTPSSVPSWHVPGAKIDRSNLL